MNEAAARQATNHPDLPPFFQLVALESTESTSNEVEVRAQAGASEGLLVWARQQTKGRGRQGRHWESPSGNLYCSLLLRPEVETAKAAELGFVAGVAVRDCVASLFSKEQTVRCKWPNDILVGQSKIAGILLEATVQERGTRVIVGIGVNLVNHPLETSYPATDLRSQGAATADPARVLERLAGSLLRWREVWLTEGFGAIRRTWLEHAAGLGEDISVRLPDQTLVGKFESIDERGALELLLPGGEMHIVTAGDVFLNQPAMKTSG